ncbi:MAG: hypothetical protein HKN04_03105 [Rhodothermaceae bacterium]|nr:hypothetical protein [Rhodothermaceae bacterium]
MPDPGSLPTADRSDAEPDAPTGTLPASRDEEERPKHGGPTLPLAPDAAPPETAAQSASVDEPDEEASPEAPPLPEHRKERIREATARGGLADELPQGFADPDGDWQIVEAESPFERLYLDAGQHARITPALVQRHYDLIATFWKEVVAGLDGPGQARIREKYGGEARAAEIVRQRARRTEQAYQQLAAEDGIEAAFAEVEARRLTHGRRQLEPSLRGMLVDGELSPLETAALFRFGRQHGLDEAETADLVQETLQREGFSAYGDPQGASLAERLSAVSWVTPERREALDRSRREARQADLRPLKLQDAAITSLDQLVAYADANPENAARRLYDGTFGSWLSGTLGEVRLKDLADELSQAYKNKPAIGTEQFVRVLSAAIGVDAAPHLHTDVSELALGTLPMGHERGVAIPLRREGPRRAWGEIEIEGALPGLTVPTAFSIDDAAVVVRVDTLRVPPGSYEGTLVVRPEGGADLRLSVSYTVVPLTVELTPPTLALGRVPFRRTKAKKLAVRCTPEGGRLVGPASLAPEHPGLAVRGDIDGPLSVLKVVVDTAQFEAGDRYKGKVKLDTNAGAFEVPLSFRVEIGWGSVALWMGLFAAVLAAGLGFYRRFAADTAARLRDFAPDVVNRTLEGRLEAEEQLVFALLFVSLAVFGLIVRALYRGKQRPKDKRPKRLKNARPTDGP